VRKEIVDTEIVMYASAKIVITGTIIPGTIATTMMELLLKLGVSQEGGLRN
jgi:hypothetical protein